MFSLPSQYPFTFFAQYPKFCLEKRGNEWLPSVCPTLFSYCDFLRNEHITHLRQYGPRNLNFRIFVETIRESSLLFLIRCSLDYECRQPWEQLVLISLLWRENLQRMRPTREELRQGERKTPRQSTWATGASLTWRCLCSPLGACPHLGGREWCFITAGKGGHAGSHYSLWLGGAGQP